MFHFLRRSFFVKSRPMTRPASAFLDLFPQCPFREETEIAWIDYFVCLCRKRVTGGCATRLHRKLNGSLTTHVKYFHSHVVRLFSCIPQPCRDLFKILMVFLTAARVAQLDKREVAGSNSGRTSTQGLKITEENVLPLLRHLQMVRHSSLLG